MPGRRKSLPGRKMREQNEFPKADWQKEILRKKYQRQNCLRTEWVMRGYQPRGYLLIIK